MNDKSDGNVKLSKPGCAKLVEMNTPLVTEGNQYLQKAVELNPTYEEAMTYLSLMARRKADLECGNVPAIKADLELGRFSGRKKSMGARKPTTSRRRKRRTAAASRNSCSFLRQWQTASHIPGRPFACFAPLRRIDRIESASVRTVAPESNPENPDRQPR